MTVRALQQDRAAGKDGAERALLIRCDWSVAVVLFLIAPARLHAVANIFATPHVEGGTWAGL
jgi:hypothetical protein